MSENGFSGILEDSLCWGLFKNVSSYLCSVSLLLQKVTFYGSSLVDTGPKTNGQSLEIAGASQPGVVTKAGLVLFGNDGKAVSPLPELCSHVYESSVKQQPVPNLSLSPESLEGSGTKSDNTCVTLLLSIQGENLI